MKGVMENLIKSQNQNPVHSSSPALWTGLYTGAALVIVMLGALFAANRGPGLEPYALERNAICYSVFVLLMLVPVCRFLYHPLQMFASAMVAWSLFFIAYDIAGMYFHTLFQVLQRTPFQALIEGAAIYGVLAVASWVGGMLIHVRRDSIELARHRAHDVTRRKP